MTKPKVIIFNGLSLDGRMDGGANEIDMGLYYGLAARWNADAMLSGSNTMLAAEQMEAGEAAPMEAAPAGPKELHPLAVPYLVIADSRGRIHSWRMLQAQPFWREVVALCSQATPPEYLAELERASVPYIVAGRERIDFAQALEALNARFGIQSLRVDSGGVLNGVLLRAGLVDEVSVLIVPTLVGGETRRGLFVAPDVASPEQVIGLKLIHYEKVGENVIWLRYAVNNPVSQPSTYTPVL